MTNIQGVRLVPLFLPTPVTSNGAFLSMVYSLCVSPTSRYYAQLQWELDDNKRKIRFRYCMFTQMWKTAKVMFNCDVLYKELP